MFSDPFFTVSKKGNVIIQIGTYRFSKHTVAACGRVRWMCSYRTCKARLFSEGKIIVSADNSHNH